MPRDVIWLKLMMFHKRFNEDYEEDARRNRDRNSRTARIRRA